MSTLPASWMPAFLALLALAGLATAAALGAVLRRVLRQRSLLSDELADAQAELDRVTAARATQPLLAAATAPIAPIAPSVGDAALLSAGVALIDWELGSGRIHYRGAWAALVGEETAALMVPEAEAWLRLIHPRDLAPLQAGLQQLVSGDLPRLQRELRLSGGERGSRWVAFDARVLDGDPLGAPRHLLATLVDVQARKQLEMSLLAERRLFGSGPVMLLQLEPAPPYRIREASAGLGEATERPALGRPFADLVHGADVAAFLAAAAQASGRSGGEGASCELRLQQREGPGHWYRLHVQAERDDRSSAGLRGYLTSIDALKQAEAQSAARSRTLQQQVQKMTANQRFMHGLQQLTELLQAAETMADAGQVLQQAGPELMPRFAGAIAVTVGPGRSERLAEWGGPIDAAPRVSAAAAMVAASAPAAAVPAGSTVHDCWAVRRGRLHAVNARDARRGLSPVCGHFGGGPLLPHGFRHTLCAPLRLTAERVGALHLATRDPLTDESLRAAAWSAETLADALTLSLANLHLRASLRDQAVRDWMTGLFNRRHFDQVLQQEISRAQRSGDNLTLAVLDIDHFKSFNDAFGHEAGDEVIKAVATQLMGSVRSYDTTCRIGGEELAVLMPRATLEEARMRLDRLRQTIGALELSHDDMQLPAVTVSIGVADLTEGPGEDLQRRADVALYAAKRSGRNRVVVWTDSLGTPSELGALDALFEEERPDEELAAEEDRAPAS